MNFVKPHHPQHYNTLSQTNSQTHIKHILFIPNPPPKNNNNVKRISKTWRKNRAQVVSISVFSLQTINSTLLHKKLIIPIYI